MKILRIALGIVPDGGTQLNKDRCKSNLEASCEDHEISDGSDKYLNDDGKFHDKDSKNRTDDARKAVKIKTNERGRDANELGSHEKQQKRVSRVDR